MLEIWNRKTKQKHFFKQGSNYFVYLNDRFYVTGAFVEIFEYTSFLVSDCLNMLFWCVDQFKISTRYVNLFTYIIPLEI